MPHFSCANAFTDPTHRHYFGYQSLHYVTDEHGHSHYSQLVRFRRLETKILFYPSLANKLVHRLANARPLAYEKRWAWMFPAWYLYYRISVVKQPRA